MAIRAHFHFKISLICLFVYKNKLFLTKNDEQIFSEVKSGSLLLTELKNKKHSIK
jgi:hypothetical protein